MAHLQISLSIFIIFVGFDAYIEKSKLMFITRNDCNAGMEIWSVCK